jgi:nucleoid-associated protein YgaU
MKKQELVYLLGLFFVLVLAGCVVRTYPLIRDRVDQDLNAGNRGYLKGEVPAGAEMERKTTRTTRVVEFELHSPIKFENAPKQTPIEETPLPTTEDSKIWGNRGFITQSEAPEIAAGAQETKMEKYTVEKHDTLQKISRKFYGTTKKWNKIYKANQDVLKAPNKIYPGQVINVPVESKELKEPAENLK